MFSNGFFIFYFFVIRGDYGNPNEIMPTKEESINLH